MQNEASYKKFVYFPGDVLLMLKSKIRINLSKNLLPSIIDSCLDKTKIRRFKKVRSFFLSEKLFSLEKCFRE